MPDLSRSTPEAAVLKRPARRARPERNRQSETQPERNTTRTQRRAATVTTVRRVLPLLIVLTAATTATAHAATYTVGPADVTTNSATSVAPAIDGGTAYRATGPGNVQIPTAGTIVSFGGRFNSNKTAPIGFRVLRPQPNGMLKVVA